MLNSTTLEVAIGMALVFLLVSLLCTAINEFLAGLLGTRAAVLERGIKSLFANCAVQVQEPDGTRVLKPVAELIYGHGLVQSLYASGAERPLAAFSAKCTLPSYIPSRTFAAALCDILFGSTKTPLSLESMLQDLGVLPDCRAKQALITLVRDAQGDAIQTRRALENWYNDAMDRVSGWYKQRTQVMLFFIGLALALLLNINAVAVARVLWSTPALRAYATSTAQTYAAQQSAASPRQIRANLESLQSVGLPLGWDNQHWPWETTPFNTPNGLQPGGFSVWLLGIALFGWLVTAFSTTLGAPFWFDLLNQFMVIRSTIKPNEKSKVEASKDSA